MNFKQQFLMRLPPTRNETAMRPAPPSTNTPPEGNVLGHRNVPSEIIKERPANCSGNFWSARQFMGMKRESLLSIRCRSDLPPQNLLRVNWQYALVAAVQAASVQWPFWPTCVIWHSGRFQGYSRLSDSRCPQSAGLATRENWKSAPC